MSSWIIKSFWADNPEEIDNLVNNWLDDNNSDDEMGIIVRDIKTSFNSGDRFSCCATIIYRFKNENDIKDKQNRPCTKSLCPNFLHKK